MEKIQKETNRNKCKANLNSNFKANMNSNEADCTSISYQNSKYKSSINEDYILFKAINFDLQNKNETKIKIRKRGSRTNLKFSFNSNSSSMNREYKDVDLRKNIQNDRKRSKRNIRYCSFCDDSININILNPKSSCFASISHTNNRDNILNKFSFSKPSIFTKSKISDPKIVSSLLNKKKKTYSKQNKNAENTTKVLVSKSVDMRGGIELKGNKIKYGDNTSNPKMWPEPDHNVFTNEVITLMSQSKYDGDKSETESRPQSNIGTRVILSRNKNKESINMNSQREEIYSHKFTFEINNAKSINKNKKSRNYKKIKAKSRYLKKTYSAFGTRVKQHIHIPVAKVSKFNSNTTLAQSPGKNTYR